MNGTWEAGDQSPLFEDLEAEEAKPETVGFSVALHHLRAGGLVRREAWGARPGAVFAANRLAEIGVEPEPHLVYVEGDCARLWTPNATDLFADDWVLVPV